MSDSVEEGAAFLAHHGILGMHWGSRKSKVSTARKVSSGKKKKSQTRKDLEAAGTIVGIFGAPYALVGVGKALVAADNGKKRFNAHAADKYAKKFGTTNYHENVVKNLGDIHGEHAIHLQDENKFQESRQYLLRQAAGQRAAEDAMKSIGSAGVRMSKVSGVWKFVKIGAEDA